MKEKTELRILMAMVAVIALVTIIVFSASGCGGKNGGGGISGNSVREEVIKDFQGFSLSCATMYKQQNKNIEYAYIGSTVIVSSLNYQKIESILSLLGDKYPNVYFDYSYWYVDALGNFQTQSTVDNVLFSSTTDSALFITLDTSKIGSIGGGTLYLNVNADFVDDSNQSFTETVASGSCPNIKIYPRYQLFALYDSSGNKISADKDIAGNVITPNGITVTISKSDGSFVTDITLNDIFFTTTSQSETNADLITGFSPEQLMYFSYSDKIVPLDVFTISNSADGLAIIEYSGSLGSNGYELSISPNQPIPMNLYVDVGSNTSPGTYQEKLFIYDPDTNYNPLYCPSYMQEGSPKTGGNISPFVTTLLNVTIVVTP